MRHDRTLAVLALLAGPSMAEDSFTDRAPVLASEAAALPTAGCDVRPAADAGLADWLAWDLGSAAPRADCDTPGATRWLVTWEYQGRQHRQWLQRAPGEDLPVRVTLR